MTALFRSVDPADGEELTRDATMTWRETDALLDPAPRAFGGWSALAVEDRAERLAPLAAVA